MKNSTEQELKNIDSKKTGPNIFLYYKGTQALGMVSGEKWYKRLWNVLINPLTYIFAGKLRY